MQNRLFFDFTVDKSAKTVSITREFDAGLSLVWDAFTKAEILDQWWAPKPWTSKTKFMHFSVGGKRFYAMVSPEGQERWVLQQYTSISPKTNFKLYNAFADKDENPELPGSDWDYSFSEQQGKTTVHISIYNESPERMERLIETGFKEGFTKALENLDGFLTQNKIPDNKTVSINLPVKNLEQSVDFYTALGFQNYPYTSGDVKYMFWSQHISLTLMSREKFASLVPKPLSDTKQTMGSFFTLSVSSLDELNAFMERGLDAGGTEPTEKDDYGFMHQRTIEDFDGHCWNVLFIEHPKILTEQP
jgi:predicted lactoylglutathione lyase/uncharacterized protein YndB with AHSA1/START domain